MWWCESRKNFGRSIMECPLWGRLVQGHAFGLLRWQPRFDPREGIWAGVSVPTYGPAGGSLGTGREFQGLGPNGYGA